MTFEGYAQKIIEITSMVKCMINIYHWDNKFKHFIGNHCHAVTLVSLVFMQHMLATQPSLHILSVNKSLLRFLHVNSYFGHGTTPYATKLLFFVFSKLHPSTSLFIFYCLLILCSRNTKHHNRQRLVLEPDSLLNVYTSISY